MTTDEDRYGTWDAAYVLGALSPEDRREFEGHLAGCERCRAAVADLAGVPGMLALVPRDEALSMVGEVSGGNVRTLAPKPPERMFQSLVAETRRRRSRRRWATIGVAVASAAAAVAISVPIAGGAFDNDGGGGGGGSTVPSASQVVAERGMSNLVPGPLTADFKLSSQPGGGTRIDMRCSYDASAGVGYTGNYAMYVTDINGVQSQLATWQAKPGETVTPSAVTSVAADQIRKVDIRSAATDQVLLVGDV